MLSSSSRRRVRGLAGLVVLLVAAACSAADGPARDPAPTALPTTADTTTDRQPPSCAAEPCSLAEVGAAADLRIGSAAKLGDPAREALEVRELSALSTETELLWSVVHPAPGVWDFGPADRVVAFAEAHDMELTATHLVWDPPAIRDVLPDWVRAITDPDELRAVIRDHLTVLHDRYGDRIDRWDVVNEPLDVGGDLDPSGHFLQVLGPGYVADTFAMASEVWPGADLVLNENLVEYFGGKADGLLSLVTRLVAEEVPIDRVSLQGHLFLGEPDWDLLDGLMGDLEDLGLGVDISEVDVPAVTVGSEERITSEEQAAWAARLVRTCLAHPSCASFTFWGIDDGDTWLDGFLQPGTAPLPFDADLEPKPMYGAIHRALAEGRPP